MNILRLFRYCAYQHNGSNKREKREDLVIYKVLIVAPGGGKDIRDLAAPVD